jgi:RNA polymerase sigma-70 factor, ECF subfamily
MHSTLPPGESVELVADLQSADPAVSERAFERVVEQYSPLLRRFFRRLFRAARTRCWEDDVLQETFLKLLAWCRQSRLRPDQGLTGFLRTVLRHKAIDTARRRANRTDTLSVDRTPLAQQPGSGFAVPDPRPGPVNWLLTRERDELVQAALSRLDPAERDLIRSRYENGHTLQRISSQCGTPLATVASRLDRVKERLRSLLGGQL